MFLSGKVDIPRPFAMTQDMLHAKRRSVMPAHAGIQWDPLQIANTQMDSLNSQTKCNTFGIRWCNGTML